MPSFFSKLNMPRLSNKPLVSTKPPSNRLEINNSSRGGGGGVNRGFTVVNNGISDSVARLEDRVHVRRL